jgi:branched-chain amino acid transport system ATP-binding protein
VTALLEARGLAAGYHGHPIVQDLDLEVNEGEIVALLGANGAGKTTTLLTLAGELPLLGGEVWFAGKRTKAPLHRRVRRGLGLVTEERSIFPQLSVLENLKVGRCDIEEALNLFEPLRALLARRAGLLSGGEQQMLSLARALARNPRCLLADELSLGLAPLTVTRLLKAVRQAADERGVGVLLVEQHVRKAVAMADRVYVMRRGSLVFAAPAEEARRRLPEIENSYLMGSEAVVASA